MGIGLVGLELPFSAGDVGVGALVAMPWLLWAVLYAVRHRGGDGAAVAGAAFAKVAACLVYGLLNVYYFAGASDVIGFHINGLRSAELLSNDVANGTNNFLSAYPFFLVGSGNASVRFHSLCGLLHYLLFGSFLGTSVVCAAAGFVGQVLLYRVFVSIYPDRRVRVWWVAGILFFPSLVYWSAGMHKDAFGIFGLGCALYGLNSMLAGLSVRGFLCTALGVYTLMLFRLQLLPVLLSSLLPWLLNPYAGPRLSNRLLFAVSVALRFSLLPAIVWLFVTAGEIETRLSLAELPASIARENSLYSDQFSASSAVRMDAADVGWSSVISTLPSAVVFTLYRPFPWEVNGVVMLVASAENAALLFLTARAAFKIAKRPVVLLDACRDMHLLVCVIFVVTLSFALGMSTPNFGTIARYRMPLIPFMIGILAVIDYHSLLRRTPRPYQAVSRNLYGKRPASTAPRRPGETTPASRPPAGGGPTASGRK